MYIVLYGKITKYWKMRMWNEKKENSIIWDWIEIAIEIISGMDILCLMVLSYYSPNLFINVSLSLMNHIFGE